MKCCISYKQQSFDLYGQADSPELLETPDTMEMTENFTKVTEYLTKFGSVTKLVFMSDGTFDTFRPYQNRLNICW